MEGAARSPWPLSFDTFNPNRCTGPATPQLWTAETREGDLIFCCCSEPWQTHKEQRSNSLAYDWEAFEIPFGEVWVFCFVLFAWFNFLRTTQRRLRFQISSNGCNQSINKYVLSTYYVPRFLPRRFGVVETKEVSVGVPALRWSVQLG